MNGRFINDVIEFKCKDGMKREAMIIKDFNNGKFDVAYIKSNGCKNVTVHIEENVNENRLLGASVHKATILPYQVGDLVAYYIEPEIYYLAHIIEVGAYNTVKVLLGDLFMNEWVQDKKKGDVVETDVKNIRWDGKASGVDKKTKIKYGYEPQELIDPNWKSKLALRVGKIAMIGGAFALVLLGTSRLYKYSENQHNSISVNTPQVIENKRLSAEIMDSYMPIERIFAEIYKKPLEDVTQKEKSAITYLKVSERVKITGQDYWYTVDYSINDGEISHIDYDTSNGIDSYNFSEFSGVKKLVLRMEDLKTVDFISSMPNVREFEMRYSSVSDITVLEKATIEDLILDHNNEISDYSVLSRMKGLKELLIDCDAQKLETITEDLVDLQSLTTDEMSIVKKCPNLKSLYLSYFFASTNAKDFSIITNHDSIEELFIANGNINESAKGLFSMKNLKRLSLNECQLRINPDQIPNNDMIMSLSVNNVTFVENYVEDRSGFIYYIDYDKAELVDHMDFFNHFGNLQKLVIKNQRLNDISCLSNLTELVTLDLTGNFITDFTPLNSLPKLQQVTIKDNPFNVDPGTIKIGNGVQVIYQ